MDDNELIVEALEQERDKLRNKIVHLEGTKEMATDARMKEQLQVSIKEKRDEISRVNKLIAKHKGENGNGQENTDK